MIRKRERYDAFFDSSLVSYRLIPTGHGQAILDGGALIRSHDMMPIARLPHCEARRLRMLFSVAGMDGLDSVAPADDDAEEPRLQRPQQASFEEAQQRLGSELAEILSNSCSSGEPIPDAAVNALRALAPGD